MQDPLVGGNDHKIKHALQVLIAASLAESKHIGSRTWGDADDRVKVTNLALLATDRDTEHAEALINEMIGAACDLVEQNWPDIEALAERLLIKGRVNFLETNAAVQKALTLLTRRGAQAPKPPLGYHGARELPSPLARRSREPASHRNGGR